MQMKTGQDFEENFKIIEDFIAHCGKNAIICTPEVALSGFVYQKINEAGEFSKVATERLLECSAKYKNTLITTMIEQKIKSFLTILKCFIRVRLSINKAKISFLL